MPWLSLYTSRLGSNSPAHVAVFTIIAVSCAGVLKIISHTESLMEGKAESSTRQKNRPHLKANLLFVSLFHNRTLLSTSSQ